MNKTNLPGEINIMSETYDDSDIYVEFPGTAKTEPTMSKNQTITVAQLLEMQPGTKEKATWINDDFEAVVSDVKAGDKMTRAVLSDPHNPRITISATFWSAGIARFDGKLCHFSGKGMTRTEYKGDQQVTIGEKATVQIMGAAPAGAGSAGGDKGTGAAHGARPASGVNGATVGMAINQAAAMIRETDTFTQGGLQYLHSPQFSADLYVSASDILRVSRLLESGKLAESAKHRADPGAKEREEAEKKAKEDAERKAKEEAEARQRREQNLAPSGTGSVDDDVPF